MEELTVTQPTIPTDNYTQPEDVTASINSIPEPIKPLTPLQDFDYTGAIEESGSPSEILDFLESDSKNLDEFDFKGARASASDVEVLDFLMKRSDKARSRFAKDTYGDQGNFALGVGKGLASLRIGINDIAHAIHLTDDNEHNKAVSKARRFISNMDSAREHDGFWSDVEFSIGQVAPELVALPVSAQSRVAIFALGSASSYASARGEGMGVEGSLKVGALGGVIGLGANEVVQSVGRAISGGLSKQASQKVHDYYQAELQLTDKQVNDALGEYYKIMEPSGNKLQDRTMAMIDYAGKKGASIKSKLAIRDKSLQEVTKDMTDRHNAMLKAVDGDYDMKEFGAKFSQASDEIKLNYKSVKHELGKKYDADGAIGPIKELPELVEDALVSDRNIVKSLLEKSGATVTDYMDAYAHVNALYNKSKGAFRKQWEVVKGEVDSKLKDALGDDHDYWKVANASYSNMLDVQSSALGKTIGKLNSSKSDNINVNKVLKILESTEESGDIVFDKIRYMVGDKEAQKFEMAALRQIVKPHADDLSWKAFGDTSSVKGFSTVEAKNLDDLLQTTAKAFRTDDALSKSLIEISKDSNSIANSVRGKLNMTLVGKAYRGLTSLSPTKGGEQLRRERDLLKMLKSPKQVKDLKDKIYNMSEAEKALYEVDVLSKDSAFLQKLIGGSK